MGRRVISLPNIDISYVKNYTVTSWFNASGNNRKWHICKLHSLAVISTVFQYVVTISLSYHIC